MKQLKMTALAIALSTAAASSAMAQSAKTNAWEGFYGQVGVGYGMFNPTISPGTAQVPAGFGGAPSAFTGTTSGTNVNNIGTATANLGIGYNFGVNKDFVLGLAASYYPGASSSATGQLNIFSPLAPNGPAIASSVATYNIKNLYSITLNPGYVIDKDSLAYAKVGYTGATVGLSSSSIPYSTINLTGWTLGLGYKQMVTSSIYAFGEVNYASYGNQTPTLTAYGVVPVTATFKGTGTDILVGVGYRF